MGLCEMKELGSCEIFLVTVFRLRVHCLFSVSVGSRVDVLLMRDCMRLKAFIEEYNFLRGGGRWLYLGGLVVMIGMSVSFLWFWVWVISENLVVFMLAA